MVDIQISATIMENSSERERERERECLPYPCGLSPFHFIPFGSAVYRMVLPTFMTYLPPLINLLRISFSDTPRGVLYYSLGCFSIQSFNNQD
jgi:hypothetical protein